MHISQLLLSLFLSAALVSKTLGADHAKLSAPEASQLAVQLANRDCKLRFGASPFEPSAGTLNLVEGRWRWKAIAGYGRGDLVAEVSFSESGDRPAVRVSLMDSRK